MLVYILNKYGKPLMPCSASKARKLLKENKAKVIKIEPFTIQLLYGSSGYKQEIALGIDAGSKVIGLSATTKSKELYSAEVQLRNDIVDLLSTRRQNRRMRRNRLRYRKPRFLNRVKSKNKGWLAPSIENKIQTHLTIVGNIHKTLPISKMIVEVVSFDIQKIKNPSISGTDYQQGEQMDFWNIREYVLIRDGHQCQACKGKSKDRVLEVHHVVYRSEGGTDKPSNLITLCSKCHCSENHRKGKVLHDWMINGKKTGNFKDATFMGIMRWSFYNRLKKMYPLVSLTYGYITKNTRIRNELPKEHRVDALCISGNPQVKRLDHFYFAKKVRCHNRQIHKANILKGGIKKLNQAQFEVKGFRIFDKIQYQRKHYYIFGRRNSGFFDIRSLDGTKVNKGSVNCKSFRLIERRKSLLTERRTAG